MTDLIPLGKRAKAAARVLGVSNSETRNRALLQMADLLRKNIQQILNANENDLINARNQQMKTSFIDRLALTEKRIEEMALAMEDVSRLPDPVGVVENGRKLSNGVQLYKTKVPFGVVGMIYEARPNVTADAASLCIKSGNACILRGSKEALHSNLEIVRTLRSAVSFAGLPEDCIQFVEDVTREGAAGMMTLNGYLDLLIPRGGKGLIQSVIRNATVPVVETGAGNCHLYVDADADLEMAVKILENAKCQRPSVCNACETVLVHQNIAEQFYPLAKACLDRHSVEWRGCEKTRRFLPNIVLANEEDYATEFNDMILAARIVDSLKQAVDHIRQYSTGHSECIVTNNYVMAQAFTSQIDAAAVYVNASTRFTDGGEFGLGAEIGISTQKMHTRGPMGLSALTCDKYVLFGSGQVRNS